MITLKWSLISSRVFLFPSKSPSLLVPSLLAQMQQDIMKAEQRVQGLEHDEQLQSRYLRTEYDMALQMTQARASESQEQIAKMQSEMSQQAVAFQQHEQ